MPSHEAVETKMTRREHGVPREFPAALVRKVSQTLAITDFVDVLATGTATLTANLIPARAVVLGTEVNVTGAFDGDVTAVMSIGIAGDLDRFSVYTGEDCFTVRRFAVVPEPTGNAKGFLAAVTPVVTVTCDSDFTLVVAAANGACTVTFYYIETATL